jgi:hypothetical protein
MDSGLIRHRAGPEGSASQDVDATNVAVAASAADWQDAEPRVTHYLRALGVRDARDMDRLLPAIRARFEHQVATTLVADAIETGIDETLALLDEWLSSELGPDVTEATRRAARAAVLGGGVHGWTGYWSGRKPGPLGQRIRACSLWAVPDPAPLSMPTQTIHPCCYRLIRRIAKLLLRLGAGRRAGRADFRQST